LAAQFQLQRDGIFIYSIAGVTADLKGMQFPVETVDIEQIKYQYLFYPSCNQASR
jgi:hypothetical protein